MIRALGEYTVEGVPTTIPAHLWVLESKEFKTGRHTTTWAERPPRPTCRRRPSSACRARRRVRDALPRSSWRSTATGCPCACSTSAAAVVLAPERHQEHVHGEVRAEMQGTIVKVLVEKGQDIRAGEGSASSRR